MKHLGRRLVQAAVPLTFLLVPLVMLRFGAGELGTREALRATARVALILFCLAFAARPLHQLLQRPATAWLLGQRRLLGVCFGLSLSAHVGLIIRLFYLAGGFTIPEGVTLADIAIGGPGLITVALMVVTSAQRVRDGMSPRTWQRLHRFGIYFVWFIFVACLLNSISEKADRYPAIQYVPFLTLLALAMGVRICAAVVPRIRERQVHSP